ncbi:MAG: AAA family ATPase, partial [Bacteroidales bacterium]|nr:AAA family ATPase [Bacteroidales bacterium]
MGRSGFFYRRFKDCFPYEMTDDQDKLLLDIAGFISDDDHDIMVVDGYAGTGKTTAVSAVIGALDDLRPVKDGEPEEICILLAPTGRAAKVLSHYSGKPASTIHKCIYRQKSFGDDGFGQFSLAPNKQSHKLFIVDEVSLIGTEDVPRQGTAMFGT